MTFPFVSRLAYEVQERRAADWKMQADAWQVAFTDLQEKYHALKVQGATVRPVSRAVEPPAPPEERLLKEAEADYEENAFAALVSQGASELEARTIAKQMRAELLNLSVSVPGYDG